MRIQKDGHTCLCCKDTCGISAYLPDHFPLPKQRAIHEGRCMPLLSPPRRTACTIRARARTLALHLVLHAHCSIRPASYDDPRWAGSFIGFIKISLVRNGYAGRPRSYIPATLSHLAHLIRILDSIVRILDSMTRRPDIALLAVEGPPRPSSFSHRIRLGPRPAAHPVPCRGSAHRAGTVRDQGGRRRTRIREEGRGVSITAPARAGG